MKYQILNLESIEEYRKKYLEIYCNPSYPIFTFDSIRIKFFPDRFEHAFFESTDWKKSDKSIFSNIRAERILWIKDTLEDPTAELRQGWDREQKIYKKDNRVAIVKGNYVVVIWLQKNKTAKFITAYVADKSINMILSSPIWIP